MHARPDHTHVRVFKQLRTRPQSGSKIGLGHEQQIDEAIFEFVEHIGSRHAHVQHHPRRFCADTADHLAQQHRHHIVRGAQSNSTLGCGGVESWRLGKHGPYLRQAVAHRVHQAFGQGRALQAPSHRDQQVVAKVLAQPRQRRTRGRLPDVQSVAGARHVAFLEQDVERDKQVEIESVQAHGKG